MIRDVVRSLALMAHERPPVAMCPICPDEVLVATFRWPKAEFYCLACGSHLGWLDPRAAPETPELVARIAAAEAAFDLRFPA